MYGAGSASTPLLGAPGGTAASDIWRCASWMHAAIFGSVPFLGTSADSVRLQQTWPPASPASGGASGGAAAGSWPSASNP